MSEAARAVRCQMVELHARRQELASGLAEVDREIERLKKACPHDWGKWVREHELNDDHGRESWWCGRDCTACGKHETGSIWDYEWDKLVAEGKADGSVRPKWT